MATRGQLRWNYDSIFPDVYQPKAAVPSLRPRTVGAWLWSGREDVVAGPAAALDLARHLPRDAAIQHLDALARATRVSAKETRLRLVLIDAGFPRPRTQIRVRDGFNTAFLDMGWDEPMIGMDYDGDQHQFDRERYVHDIGRNEVAMNWSDARAGSTSTWSPTFEAIRRSPRRGGVRPPWPPVDIALGV